MALITSPSDSERKIERKSSKGEINESKKDNIHEYAKKSNVNKKRNYKKHTASSKGNTNFTITSSRLPYSVFHGQYSLHNMPVLPISYPVLPCFPQYLPTPLAYNWSLANICTMNPVCSFSGPPLSVVPPHLLSTQIFPYTCPVTSPILSELMLPVASPLVELSPLVYDSRSANVLDRTAASSINVCRELLMESLTGGSLNSTKDLSTRSYRKEIDPIEFYLTLPKDIFPTARMLAVDPNPLVDEFCRQVDIYKHTSWILDLEFGVPRAPVTRSIATYDVQFNSVHCKNTPGAIHPGFESCSEDFKKVFLFYYDCVISSWYRGYMMITADESVANFQQWLQFPMQLLGMCWP